MLTVTVVELPGAVQELALENGAKVSDALRLANVSSSGYSIKVDGSPAEPTTRLTDGARIIVSKAAKGNS